MGTTQDLTVWTMGHSTRPIGEFMALLKENDVEAVADVRRFAGSRKNPQYNPPVLREALRGSGLEYEELPELGGRRKPLPDSKNLVWRNEAFRGYADHMETPEFACGLRRLVELAGARRTAVMCAEAVWWRCHRSLIADALKAGGARVLHIMGDGRTTEHPYTAAARASGGTVSYHAHPAG